MSESRTTVLFNCGTRARKLQSVGSRGISNSSGPGRTAAVLPSDQCFIPDSLNVLHFLTFSLQLDNLTFYIALCSSLPSCCPDEPLFSL